jgi:hypothetical protein
VRLPIAVRCGAASLLALAFSGAVLIRLTPVLEPLTLARPSLCAMKLLTGYPCLACRGTRAAFALAQGAPGRALAFNPLATLLIGSLLISATLAVVRGEVPTLRSVSRPWATLLWCLGAAALLGNWAYVIAAGG